MREVSDSTDKLAERRETQIASRKVHFSSHLGSMAKGNRWGMVMPTSVTGTVLRPLNYHRNQLPMGQLTAPLRLVSNGYDRVRRVIGLDRPSHIH